MDNYLRKIFEEEMEYSEDTKYEDYEFQDWKSYLHREDFIKYGDKYAQLVHRSFSQPRRNN